MRRCRSPHLSPTPGYGGRNLAIVQIALPEVGRAASVAEEHGTVFTDNATLQVATRARPAQVWVVVTDGL